MITTKDAAVLLHCPVCCGPVVPGQKPWRFHCRACTHTWRCDDAGTLQRALRRRLYTPPSAPAVHSDSHYLPERIS